MKKLFLLTTLFITAFSINAQTTYTYTGTGDWTDTANWSPSYPGLFIPNGDTVIISEGSQATVPNGSGGIGIEGKIDIDGILIINTTSSFSTIGPLFNIRINSTGTLENNSTIFNNGNFINTGMLINNGFINNDRLFSSGGSGDFNNQNVIRNRTGGEMNLSSSSPFVNMNSGIFNDLGGQLTLLGTNLTGNFSNSGSITFFSAGIFGTLTNTDTGTIANPDSNFTIFSGGTIINDGTINTIRNFTISSGGTLTNSGFLNINNFTFAINSGGILINSTTGAITNNATFINNSDLTNNGSLINNNVYTNNGFLRGTNIAHTGDFVNAALGNVSPGGILPENLIGTYTFNDNFILQSSGFLPTLFIDINGNTQAGIDYDQVNVTGDITLAGRLLVQLPFGYIPQVGDEYTILTGANVSGTFDQTSLPPLAMGLIWEINYNPTNVVLTAGCEVPVTFTAPAAICLDAGIQANLSGGLSEGGVYSGPGVTDDGNGMTYSFDPQVAGAGIHVITYTFINEIGCSDSASDTIEVFNLPMITFVSPAPICIDAGVQTGLGGATPSGGVYSGTGVTDDGNGMTYNFDPQAAGAGIHVIIYTFTNGIGCSNSASDTIEVFDIPIITFVSPAPTCIDAGVQNGLGGATPSGGVYSGTGVTDDGNGTTYSFDPAVAGIGTHPISYTYTDGTGCTDSAIDTIEVFAVPNVTFIAPDDVCLNAGIQTGLTGGTPSVTILSTTVTLNISYDVFGFSGFVGGDIVFDGSGAMLSTDVTANNDANGSTTSLVNATALGDTITLTFDNNQTPNIIADTTIIGASGTINFISGTDFTVGGDLLNYVSGNATASTDLLGTRLYSGPGVTNDANGITYSFNPAIAGLGIHTITYTYTVVNGCTDTANDTIEVFDCLEATAFNFDGIDDYAVALDPSVLDITTGTIEMRIRPKTKATSQTILAYRSSDGLKTKYLFNLLGNLSGIGFWNGSGFYTVSYAFTEDEWYNISIIDDDSGSTTVYVNGVSIGTFASEFGTATGNDLNLYVGVDFPLNEYFKGDIDDIRIWNTIKTGGSLACDNTPTDTDLLAYYNFNQGLDSANNIEEDMILDMSLNTNHLLLTNTALIGTTSNWVATENTITLPSRLYVNENATGLNNGRTWTDAFIDLQDAISAASTCNIITEIWVAAGTYKPSALPRNNTPLSSLNFFDDRHFSFHLVNNVAMYGGFSGNENDISERNLGLNPTFLSGDIGVLNDNSDNIQNIITSINDSANTIVDGFIIEGANANRAFPVIVGDPCEEEPCPDNSGPAGGATIEGQTITFSNGAAINASNTSIKIQNCIFRANSATLQASLYFGSGGLPLISNTLFYDNIGNLSILFIDQIGSTQAELSNLTFINNTLNLPIGSNAIASISSLSIIKNTVLFNNTTGIDINSSNPNSTNNSVSNASGNGTLLTTDPFVNSMDIDGSDNILGTPDDGLIPLEASVLVDAGDIAFNSLTTDIAGQIRNLGATIDVGAYEYQSKLTVAPKVYLQGAMLGSTDDAMRDDLRTGGYLPTTSPYVDAITCNASVFNTGGTTGTGLTEDDIVDWVYIELRDETDNTQVITATSALLQRDGDIVGTDGLSPLEFLEPYKNYFITIKHRNHLGVVTSNALSLNGTSTLIDFTDATTPITFGTNAQTTFGMPANTLGLWAGNANGDTIVQYSGTSPDSPSILSNVLNDSGNSLNFPTYTVNGYNNHDVNMDGNTQYTGTTPDTPFILQNTLAHPGNFLNFSTYAIEEQLPEN